MAEYDPVPRYDFGPDVVTSGFSTAAIDVGRVEELQATLGSHEFYETALTGTNNDILWVARTPGTSALTLTYVVSGNDTPLSAVIATNDITVNVATSGAGAATSTAQDILDYVNTDEAASEVEQAVYTELAAGNDGTGVVTALAQQSLGGPTGTSPTMDVKLQSSIDGTNWLDVAAFTQLTGTAAKQQKIFVGLGDKSRWTFTNGGTSPKFVISIACSAKGE